MSSSPRRRVAAATSSPAENTAAVVVARTTAKDANSSSPSSSHSQQQQQGGGGGGAGDMAVLDSMSVSAWPSGRAGATPDFVQVLDHFIINELQRIDGTCGRPSNFTAIARCDVLRKCCTAFEHHFNTYRHIFAKMGQCVDVVSAAFDAHHKTAMQVEQWKDALCKREATLKQQMLTMVEQHEREYATEAELKKQVEELQQQLKVTRKDLDETYRNYVRAQDMLNEANERNDELSRQHVILTMRESKVRDHIDRLERQVEVSHNHAEAKAREVGELRQEIAANNARAYRSEAKAREQDAAMQTMLQTLARKDRDIEEKEMELARLKAAPQKRMFDEEEEAERVAELVAQREQEIVRSMTPRPDWDALNEKHQMRALVNEGATSKSRSLPTKRWAELLSVGLRQSQEQQDVLAEETHKLREKVDQSSLHMAMVANNNYNYNQQSSSSSSPGKKTNTSSPRGGKRVRAGLGGSPIGSKSGGADYCPLSSPDYLRATHPIPSNSWSLADVLQYLTPATDYIIAHLVMSSDHNNNNNNNNNSGTASLSSSQQLGHNSLLVHGGGDGSSSSMTASMNSHHQLPPAPGATSSQQQQHHGKASSAVQQHHQGGFLRGRFSSMSETQIIAHFLDQAKGNPFAENFQNWLVMRADANGRRAIAYNLIYHAREKYFNDVFCKAFCMALGGDVPPDTFQRIRVFVLSFRRSFEMCDPKCCGYAAKRTLTTMIKNLMSLYSATEQRMVIGTLDDLPQMSSRADTLVDYRVLFGPWEKPTQFMTLTSWIFFRSMCIDMEAAVTAVTHLATASSSSSSSPGGGGGGGGGHHGVGAGSGAAVPDVSVGSLFNALQSADPKRDPDTHRDFVTRCIGQSSIKAARVALDVLCDRMRRCYLPRASAFPADPHFAFKEPSIARIAKVKDDDNHNDNSSVTPATPGTAVSTKSGESERKRGEQHKL